MPNIVVFTEGLASLQKLGPFAIAGFMLYAAWKLGSQVVKWAATNVSAARYEKGKLVEIKLRTPDSKA